MEERKCPQCHAADLAENAPFCWNCGFELGNYCENPDCVDDEFNLDDSVTMLPDKFTYCPHCGSQTRYGRLGFAVPLKFEQGL